MQSAILNHSYKKIKKNFYIITVFQNPIYPFSFINIDILNTFSQFKAHIFNIFQDSWLPIVPYNVERYLMMVF